MTFLYCNNEQIYGFEIKKATIINKKANEDDIHCHPHSSLSFINETVSDSYSNINLIFEFILSDAVPIRASKAPGSATQS